MHIARSKLHYIRKEFIPYIVATFAIEWIC